MTERHENQGLAVETAHPGSLAIEGWIRELIFRSIYLNICSDSKLVVDGYGVHQEVEHLELSP